MRIVSALIGTAAAAQVPHTSYRFDFGGKCPPGYTSVSANAIYTDAAGYGFETGSSVSEVVREDRHPLRDGFVTSDKPFFFSAAVPEGNYKVSVTFGDASGTSETTVKAELRRLMHSNNAESFRNTKLHRQYSQSANPRRPPREVQRARTNFRGMGLGRQTN